MNKKIMGILSCYQSLLSMIDDFNCTFYEEEQKIKCIEYLNDSGFDMTSVITEFANELESASDHIRLVDGEKLHALRSESYHKIHELEQRFKSIEWNK